MNLTSSSLLEKEIEVSKTVKLKIDLAFFLCRVFKKKDGQWQEKTVFAIHDMTMNEFFIYLERLEQQVLKDEAEESKFQTEESCITH